MMRSVPCKVLIAAVMLLIGSATAGADVRIRASGGGVIGDYLKLFALVKASGERVVIDGPCLSACTLVLSVVPGDRVCVTPKAVLAFHAPWLPDSKGKVHSFARAGEIMLSTYPPPVRSWIQKRGGLTSRTLWLRGKELTTLVHRCA
jgi:hypothetical protein